MKSKFKALELAIEFHRGCEAEQMPAYLKDQLLRASSSIALNLAEGSARQTRRDQGRFYHTALGSLRECQTALRLASRPNSRLVADADTLGALVYRLCHPKTAPTTEQVQPPDNRTETDN